MAFFSGVTHLWITAACQMPFLSIKASKETPCIDYNRGNSPTVLMYNAILHTAPV